MISSHYFNNTIGTLRQIIDGGIKAHKKNNGVVFENPASELKRAKVKQKDLQLPEPAQFRDLVINIRKKSGAWGERVGDLVEFLAFGGMRIHSEAGWVIWDDIDWQRKQIVVRGAPVSRVSIRLKTDSFQRRSLFRCRKSKQLFPNLLDGGAKNRCVKHWCGEIQLP